MSRIYLCLILPALLVMSSGRAATRAERGDLLFDGVPDVPAARDGHLDAYSNWREATPLGWSPKGQLLIATRFGDVDQLHVVERAGGERRQLTFLNEPIVDGAFSPDPGRNAFVFLHEEGGDGETQIYHQKLAAGLSDADGTRLTDGKSANGGALWSNSGRQLAFFSAARNGVTDIQVVEPDTGLAAHSVLSGDSAAWVPLDWSPDDRKLLVLRFLSRGDGALYVLDPSSGQKREVDPAPGRTGITNAKFSRDGQGVYLISDRDGEFARVRYVNLFTGEKTAISGQLAGDVEELALSRDGHYLAYTSNDGGISRLSLVDLHSHQDLTPPRLPAPGLVDHLSFDAESKRLAFGYSNVNRPADAFVLDVAANQLEAWTHSETGPVNAARFIVPRLIQYPTFDRPDGRMRQVPAFVYEPGGPGPHRVLILLHGGPEQQFRPGFDPFIQYLVAELGFAVVAPNVRGSSGYGKSYLAADNGLLRDDAVKDLGALIVWVDAQSTFDAKHVVVAGGGYGGYLALAGLVNYSDRLSGGVDLAGMSDFLSYLATTAPYRQTVRRAEFGDERDADMRAYLRRVSPLTNADRISRPVLVIQGRNDSDVAPGESEQLVNRLRSRGGEVWSLLANNEGSPYRRKSNRDAMYRTITQFLNALH